VTINDTKSTCLDGGMEELLGGLASEKRNRRRNVDFIKDCRSAIGTSGLCKASYMRETKGALCILIARRIWFTRLHYCLKQETNFPLSRAV